MGKHIWAIIISIFLVSCAHYTQLTPEPPPAPNDYIAGKLDAERDYQSSPAWILAGVGCGVFGVGLAMVAVPEPPYHKLMDKSPEYAAGYTQAFKAKAKRDNATYAVLGWATWIVALVAAAQ